jgi:hypothetical protein
MSDDALNVELRHTIRLCWKTLRGQQAFKSVAIDTDLAAVLPDEFAPKLQITNTWACGSSASRLCELLVGEPLENYTTSADAISTSDAKRVAQAMAAMKQTEGRVLVRINVLEGNAGHSYVFLGRNRSVTEPLRGMIYQTNVGCHKDSAFDLMAWIDDPKSYETIDLEQHLKSLQGSMTQLKAPDAAYQKNYMLSNKQLTDSEVQDLRNPRKAADFVFMWRPVDLNAAVQRLKLLRAQSSGAVKWPKVTTQTTFRSLG